MTMETHLLCPQKQHLYLKEKRLTESRVAETVEDAAALG